MHLFSENKKRIDFGNSFFCGGGGGGEVEREEKLRTQ